MYLLVLFSAVLLFAVPVHSTPVPWSKSMFSPLGYSWDLVENDDVCRCSSLDFPLVKHKSDYAKSMSEALLDLSRSGGGTLHLDAGVYPLSRPVELPDRACIIGAGMNKTILKVVDRSLPFYEQTGAIHSKNANLVTLKHFSVDGNGKGQGKGPGEGHGRNGIFLEQAKKVLIQNVEVKNNLIKGVVIRGEENHLGKHIAIEGCTTRDNGNDGLVLFRVSHVSVLRSFAVRNGGHGILVEAAEYVILRKSTIWDAGQCGLNVGPAEHGRPYPRAIHASNTAIFNAKRAGVCILDAAEVCLEKTIVQNLLGKKFTRMDADKFSSVEDVKGACSFRRQA